MSDMKEDFDELRSHAKASIKNAIDCLTEVTQNPKFEYLKSMYKDKVFDSMKKLTQIKDEL